MVDLSDFIDPGDDEEPLADDDAEAADLTALKDCLQALADAIASTNLAVVHSLQSEMQGASTRVQASVAALRRFHEAFAILKADSDDKDEADEDE